MTLTLNRIKIKIDKIREIDNKFEVFGANIHQYKIEETLTEEQVSSFEKRFNIILPNEYREFITSLGNGGVGPNYGIHSLKIVYNPTLEEFGIGSLLDKTFPFTKKWESPIDDEYPDFLKDKDIYDGCLIISYSGCGDKSLLVITGNERGKIWNDSLSNEGVIRPTGMTFYEWFESWLNNCLEGKLYAKLNH